MERLNTRQWNRIKSGGAVVALGICVGATFMHPTEARSQGGNADKPPMAGQKSGGANHDGPGNDGARHAGPPPMRPEERMTEELDLTPAQQTKIQVIFDQEREQMRVIHEKTRASVAALLTSAQKAKFDQMPQPGHGPHGDRPGGPNGDGPNGDDRREMGGAMQDEDHGRPVEQIAQDLAVTPEQFREAFKQVHPAGRGQRPTEAQLQNNHKVLAAALGVSIEKLDAVMDKYRPESPDGPPRHNPEEE